VPTVFLSYSREDLPLIEQLAARLNSHSEISIWRDQDKIYGGQKWPKILGEAIADQDVFLLAWSKNAAVSHFVDLEWTTALGLKKTIIPCLLDSTPLPPLLGATHVIPISDLPKIVAAITGSDITADVDRHSEGIAKSEQEQVPRLAKIVFGQPKEIKKRIEKWQAWVVIIGGILAAILAVLQIKDRIWPPEILNQRSSTSIEDQSAQFVEQSIAGTVFGEGDERLPGVVIKLPEFNKSVLSDENGRYQFSVKARRGQQVELLAEKNDYESMERFVSLGNEHNDFTMQRTRP